MPLSKSSSDRGIEEEVAKFRKMQRSLKLSRFFSIKFLLRFAGSEKSKLGQLSRLSRLSNNERTKVINSIVGYTQLVPSSSLRNDLEKDYQLNNRRLKYDE